MVWRDDSWLEAIVRIAPVLVVAFILRRVLGFEEGLGGLLILVGVLAVLTVLWNFVLAALPRDEEAPPEPPAGREPRRSGS